MSVPQEAENHSLTYTLPDGTKASTIDRFVPDVKCATSALLEDEQLFQKDVGMEKEIVNVALLRQHFFDEGRLTVPQIVRILDGAAAYLRAEPNLIEVDAPITSIQICGDIHGQYYDLLKVFEIAGGEPPANRILFLGDYVDRGHFSFECFIYLLALKMSYPEMMYLLRGNHESRSLTTHFTFKAECLYKYNERIFDACVAAFHCLPLAAVVNKQFFCAHGGLSPSMKKPSDLNLENRFGDPPKRGIVCDVLWSDPTSSFDEESFSDTDVTDFSTNDTRGCSFRYSFRGTVNFLEENGLLSVVRGHEAQAAGYKLYQRSPGSDFPACITLFSAANYVDVYKNKGACLKYDGKVLNIRQYTAAPHPYYLPKFMNAFDWSLPFVGEKLGELFMSVLNLRTKKSAVEDMTEEEYLKLEAEYEARESNIKQKIRVIARVNKMFQTVRNERETLTELMNVMGTEAIPAKYLILSSEDLRQAITSFEDAKRADAVNEVLPMEEEEGGGVADNISLHSMYSGNDGGGEATKLFDPMDIDRLEEANKTSPRQKPEGKAIK